MENKTIFIVYLVTWCAYLVTAHIWARRKKLHLAGVLASHAVPSAVALVMTYVFLIAGGVTVAQIVAGSETGMDLWDLWFYLWPVLLFGSAASGVISLVWTIVACIEKPQRKWIPITIAAVMMSVFAFFTVGVNYPDA